MPKSQKTLIAVIFAAILIVVAIAFILSNNYNRDKKNESIAVSSSVSLQNSQIISAPKAPENQENIPNPPQVPLPQ